MVFVDYFLENFDSKGKTKLVYNLIININRILN